MYDYWLYQQLLCFDSFPHSQVEFCDPENGPVMQLRAHLNSTEKSKSMNPSGYTVKNAVTCVFFISPDNSKS